MKDKIVFFHLLNNFTGSPAVLVNVIQIAKDSGKEIHLYTSSGKGFLSGIKGIIYHPNHYVRSKYRIFTLFTFFISQFVLAFRLIRWRKENCVFYVNTILPFSAIWMGNWLKIKTLVHVHEYEVSPKILDKFLFWNIRNHADEVITVSHFLARNPSLQPKLSKVIPNAVALNFEKKARQNTFPDSGIFRVLMLASLRPYKGINEFVRLANELPELSFVLILSDLQAEVREWENSQNLPPNLSIFPVQENVIPFYQSSSLLLNLAHPDKWLETFGMTVLEGMHFGIPAIVPTQGGVTELVQDGFNGFLVDYTELRKIGLLISQISSDKELWETLSKNSKEKAKNFSYETFKTRILRIL